MGVLDKHRRRRAAEEFAQQVASGTLTIRKLTDEDLRKLDEARERRIDLFWFSGNATV